MLPDRLIPLSSVSFTMLSSSKQSQFCFRRRLERRVCNHRHQYEQDGCRVVKQERWVLFREKKMNSGSCSHATLLLS